MPRRARISLPGVSLHLIQRGNNRSACFYADEDYLFYLDVLMEQAKKHGCAIHAWCLMTNHVHLLATPESPDSAGLMMKGLGQRYVQYVTRTYRCSKAIGGRRRYWSRVMAFHGRRSICLVRKKRKKGADLFFTLCDMCSIPLFGLHYSDAFLMKMNEKRGQIYFPARLS